MSDMSVRKAVSVIAHHVVAEALDAAISYDNIGWEDYPEVGERDFDKVMTRAGQLADKLRPSDEDYEEAYAVLVDRAEELAEDAGIPTVRYEQSAGAS